MSQSDPMVTLALLASVADAARAVVDGAELGDTAEGAAALIPSPVYHRLKEALASLDANVDQKMVITVQKPLTAPAEIMRGECSGIHPVFPQPKRQDGFCGSAPAYRRWRDAIRQIGAIKQ